MDLKSANSDLKMKIIDTLIFVAFVLAVSTFEYTNCQSCSGSEYNHQFEGYTFDAGCSPQFTIFTSASSCIGSIDGVTIFGAMPLPLATCNKYPCEVTLKEASSSFPTTVYMQFCPAGCTHTSPLQHLTGYKVSDSETPTSNTSLTEAECLHNCITSTVDQTSCTMSYHHPTGTCALYTTCDGGICNMTSIANTDYTTSRAMCATSECDCSILTAPTGADSVQCTTARPGIMPTYACSTYYTEYAPSTMICRNDGTWQGDPPTCVQSPCVTPPAPVNGAVTADGVTANYTCDTDFMLNGNDTRDCLWTVSNGPEWTGTAPTCVEAPRHGVIHVFQGYEPDSVSCRTVEYNITLGECINYTETSSSIHAVIPSPVATNESVVDCYKYSCSVVLIPSATPQDSTTYIFKVLQENDTAECNATSPMSELTGYIVTDFENATINQTMTENECLHECMMSTINGTSCTMSYQYSTSTCVLYTACEEGICNMTSTNDTDFRTTRSMCASPVCDCSQIDSGLKQDNIEAPTCTFAVPGEMPEFNCSQYHHASIPATMVCGNTGAWVGDRPVCVQSPCTDPPAPTNGTVDSDGYIAHYSCNDFLKLTGQKERTCSITAANGLDWSGNEPKCRAIACPKTIDVPNGEANVTDTTAGAEANYICDPGTIMIGDDVTLCLANGTWDTPAPYCMPTECPQLTDPAHGSVTVTKGTNPGSKGDYTCDSGYKLSHTTRLVCLTNYSWSPDPPECEKLPPPMLYIRSCLCQTTNYFENKTEDQIIAELIADTAINTLNTSLARSRLESRTDPRASSKVIGTFAIIFMSVIGVFMLLVDLLSICQKFDRMRRKVEPSPEDT